jgi:predicted dehydrogenase
VGARAALDHEVRQCKDRGEAVAAYADLRHALDDKNIDAVALATPNHWHALATVWACQAGKDVYVEKPFSYNLWEGRQMVAAARQYGRMVQVGTQRRSSPALRQAFEFLRSGQLGAVRCARAIVYRPRQPLAKIPSSVEPPTSVDYDLWCGPAPRAALRRKQLHYDWHWFWPTGNGEIGNNGVHTIDGCCWALGDLGLPPRAISLGGRFGFGDDGGETPNTQIALFDYTPAPLICEVRNLRAANEPAAVRTLRGQDRGVVIDCEGGYYAGDATGGAVFDRQGRKIKDIPEGRSPAFSDDIHLANFAAAVRSRRAAELHAGALVGHASAACAHMANLSYRLGQQAPPEAIRETIRANAELSDAFERCREHLRANGIELGNTPAVLGPWLTLDVQRECFVGEFADQANALSRRQYRTPFVVPELA